MGGSVQPGQVVKGKYRVDRVLGEGGMGVVVAAHHVGLDQKVAIKFLHPAMLAHPDICARFAREARAACKLESDHIARVLDVDALEDGTPFMVMEHLDGADLSSVRRSRQPLPVAVAVDYILQACAALGEAHALGIVHRDLKPANLFLARKRDGSTRIKVLDFGISKMDASANEASVTKTTTVMGSAEYMSPEQMLATRDVDGRADIWALGVTLYELTTATVPFPGQTITQVAALVMTSPAPPPSAATPGMPAGFDAVVLHCLEKDRNARFGSIAELVRALAPFSSAHSTAGTHISQPPAVSAGTAPMASGGTAVLPTHLARPSHPGTQPSSPDVRPPSYDRVSAPAIGVVAAPPYAASTTGAVSSTGAPLPPVRSKAPIVLGLLAFVGVASIGAFFALRGGSSSTVTPDAASVAEAVTASATSAVATTSAEPPHVEPVVTPSSAASAMPSEAPSASAAATAEASSAPSKRPAKEHHAAEGVHGNEGPARATKPVAAARNCNPPFTVDAKGIQHAKPECL